MQSGTIWLADRRQSASAGDTSISRRRRCRSLYCQEDENNSAHRAGAGSANGRLQDTAGSSTLQRPIFPTIIPRPWPAPEPTPLRPDAAHFTVNTSFFFPREHYHFRSGSGDINHRGSGTFSGVVLARYLKGFHQRRASVFNALC